MRTPSKSISHRRGGGGGSDPAFMTGFKVAFLASLLLLVSFLIRLNFQLVKQLSDDPHEGGAMGGEASGERLASLRGEVSAMKEKVATMKGAVEDIKRGQPGAIVQKEGEFPRIACTPEVAQKQAARMNKRFNEWWSHSACPDQVWMEGILDVFAPEAGKPHLVLDIGCNKGYTSADFLDALSPGTSINPKTLVDAIRGVARDMNTKFDRDGGVCNDSNKPLNKDANTKRPVEVHCFEPSPATYNMLIAARDKLMPNGVNEGTAKWNIHNLGLHEVNGKMAWHSACATAVGDELCTIVPDGTEGAIAVPVVTVDAFLKETYPGEANLPLVHMLKVDAEGLDPAVLTGATALLTNHRAIMTMFEFNPGLSEGKSPHGMWGAGGKPRRRLLEVTRWLDRLGYDCYLDTHLVSEKERGNGVLEAPALYRITGDCLTEEPRVRGWANVVCASRRFEGAAQLLRKLATMV
ncbi:hypothetical protein ACHAXT_012323 [Thalassiosira profunda]